MKEQRLTWSEFEKALQEDHSKHGVVVFKNGPYWDKEYPFEERAYKVSGDDKWFDGRYGGCSIFGNNLAGTDMGVRLDWYMRNGKDSWEVEYCYLVEED